MKTPRSHHATALVLRRRHALLLPVDPCDYSSEELDLTNDDRADAEAACRELLAELPLAIDTLPELPTDDDLEAIAPPEMPRGRA